MCTPAQKASAACATRWAINNPEPAETSDSEREYLIAMQHYSPICIDLQAWCQCLLQQMHPRTAAWICRTEISGQETIEAANHLCLFLPKFHCELNFIEFFWGVVKKYLRDNCDYTFDTLKENLPKALRSVHIHTIRRWEHRIFRWIEAYRSGLGTREAQVQVRKFSSTMYKSHRCIPEGVASAFD